MSYNLSNAINCTIYRNADTLSHGQLISIPGTMNLKQFLEKCSHKLGMSARRVFQVADGEEITHVHLIAPDVNLIITEGEEVNPGLLRNYYKHSYKNSGADDTLGTFNVAIIGPAGVGKSSIIVRYVYNTFSTEYEPTLEDQYNKFERVDDELYGLNILDTSGTEDFFSLMHVWMLNKDALILTYSVEDKEHFKALEKFNQNIKHYDPNNEIPKVIIANKTDLKKRMVTAEEGKAFADTMNAPYFEASAKLNKNITEMFIHLIKTIRDKKKIEQEKERKNEELRNPDRGQGRRKEEEPAQSFSAWFFNKCNLI